MARPRLSRVSLLRCLSFLVSPVSPVSPASEGQKSGSRRHRAGAEEARGVQRLYSAGKGAKTRRFRLARALATIQMREGRMLAPSELMAACGDWFELSGPFLDPKETFEEHLAALIAEVGKALVPRAKVRLRRQEQKFQSFRYPICQRYQAGQSRLRRGGGSRQFTAELSAANGGNTHFFLPRRRSSNRCKSEARLQYHFHAWRAWCDQDCG